MGAYEIKAYEKAKQLSEELNIKLEIRGDRFFLDEIAFEEVDEMLSYLFGYEAGYRKGYTTPPHTPLT